MARVRAFTCDVCGSLVGFEASVCTSCGTAVGYDVARARLVPVGGVLRPCDNLGAIGCNWLVRDGAASRWCLSCRLTRTRPPRDDADALAAWSRTETAKRRLVFQLLEIGLPVVPRADDPTGLAFDLLSSARRRVVTGHADGVVTLDLAEGHDDHREKMRLQMGEPYRTLLGHLRHETGHYYWHRLVRHDPVALQRFRAVFGDERASYRASLDRHYSAGPPLDWVERYVSAYATAHPWEDWAETFAHYLHVRDAVQTAAAHGMVVTGPDVAAPDPALVSLPAEGPTDVLDLVRTWVPLTFALNAVNRSMGKDDLYPFVLNPPVVDKLVVVGEVVEAAVAVGA